MFPIASTTIPTITSCLFLLSTIPVFTGSYTVMTKSGNIRGLIKNINGNDVVHFLGIPYAEPPLDKLRFTKTVPVKRWSGTKDATKFTKACWQFLPTELDLNQPAAKVWTNNTQMSEDCLYINIWVPKSFLTNPSKGKSPMLTWVFGGGFISGSSNLEIYNGAYLASKENIVVASMQYRLGPLGFLYLGTNGDTGNAGLWDQNTAIKWLKDNAEVFGADSNRMTLMGESAGAASVSLHLLSPHSQTLFSQAILHSGSFLAPWCLQTRATAQRRAINLAWAVGCISNKSLKNAYSSSISANQQILSCLRRIQPLKFIQDFQEVLKKDSTLRSEKIISSFGQSYKPKNPANILNLAAFGPVQEERFFPLTPEESYNRNMLKRAPLLLGTNRNEGSYWLLYNMPPLSTELYTKSNFSAVTLNKIVSHAPSNLIIDYILPLKFIYPEVLDEILLTYSVPSQRLFPEKYKQKSKVEWLTVLDDVSGDVNFKCCVLKLGEWYARMKQPVYVYSFEHRTKSISFPEWTGVMHGYELEYNFGMPFSSNFSKSFYKFTKGEMRLSEAMMKYWGNFVKSGDPNKASKDGATGTGNTIWPVYNNTNQAIIRLQTKGDAANILVGTNSKYKPCKLWTEVIPRLSTRLSTSCSMRISGASRGAQLSIATVLISCITVWSALRRTAISLLA